MPISLTELEAKRDEILRLADLHRVENVRVFGSVGRGGLEPWSDVDFMVDLLPGHSLLDRAGLQSSGSIDRRGRSGVSGSRPGTGVASA